MSRAARCNEAPALLIPSGQSVSHKRNNFDALRLAMALLVIWSHSFAIHLGSERSEWFSVLLNGVYNAGNLGVMAFFIISDFLIAQSYERSTSLRSYFAKRVRRIYPGYMVATTISGMVFIWMLQLRWDWLSLAKATLLNLLLRNEAPGLNAAGEHTLVAVNGALWSIPFEFWCYIGVVVLGLAKLISHRWILVALLCAIMASHVALDDLGRKPGLGIIGEIFGWPYLWTRMAPCFLLGMVGYSFRASLPRSGAMLTALLLASITGCWFNEEVGYLLVSPALAYAICFVAFADIPLHDAARFGDFSYGAYLYGFLIQRVLQATVAERWSLGAFFVVSGVLALLAGFISWHFVEKRFLRRRAASIKAYQRLSNQDTNSSRNEEQLSDRSCERDSTLTELTARAIVSDNLRG